MNIRLSAKELLRNIVADFSCSVGAVGLFVRDGISRSDRLKFLHGIHPYPGEPSWSRDRLITFANVGDVVGMDITMVAFDTAQLAITADLVVPGSIARVPQLLNEEPLATTHGPFKASEASTRTTKMRGVGYFPFGMVIFLIGADVNARQVFGLMVPALI
jgi:hypothetical protein